MPIQSCSLPNGEKGFRWGTKGKCYKSKRDAIKQGYAENNGDEKKFKQEMSKSEVSVSEKEVNAVLNETKSPKDRLLDGVASQLDEADQAVGYISQEERDKVPAADFGSPKERKFPVRNQHDLDSAAKLIGRAPPSAQMSIKQRIKEIAKRKGLKLPESWGTKDD